MYVTINAIRTENTQKRADLAKENDRQVQILKIKKQLTELSDEERELDLYFFRQSDDVRLIEELENLAKHANLDLDVSSATVVGDSTKVFRIGFKLQGSWKNVLYYVALLETLPAKLNITHVGLQSNQGDRWGGDVTFELISFIPEQGIGATQ